MPLAIITLTFFISSNVWFYLRSLDHQVSKSWYSRQCQRWTQSPGMDLRLDQSLVDHFHNIYGTLSWDHPYRWLGVSLVPVWSLLMPKWSTFPVISFNTLLFLPLLNLTPRVFVLTQHYSPTKSILFHLPEGITHPPLEPPCFLYSLCLWIFSIVIYFTVNIHL